jgi:PucR C-terminal helix-turn-helix domain
VTSVIDVWRAVDPEARLVSGSVDRLRAAVRGVARSRAGPPHLPVDADGQLLLVDAALVPRPAGLDGLLAALREAALRPVALVLTSVPVDDPAPDRAGDQLPVLATSWTSSAFADAAEMHLEHAEADLARIAAEVRLAAAEAALADPDPAAAAGLVAGRLRRGVAVSADGELRALHPRASGRALAARFAAIHARIFAEAPARALSRRTSDGLHILERRIRHGASVWLFDDLPFARIDEIAAESLTITLRALLRRQPSRPAELRPMHAPEEPRAPVPSAASDAPLPGRDVLRETLLAVARSNGRVATAARELGVHRNTVLYRLRRATVELGVDPRRPADALAILREADEPGR